MLTALMMLPRSAASPSSSGVGWQQHAVFSDVLEAANLVESSGVCSLPGCSIPHDRFMPVLLRAMSRGYVKDSVGKYVMEGFTSGFTLGVSRSAVAGVMGRRYFRNYPPAFKFRNAITDALIARVKKFKTLRLGLWSDVRPALEAVEDCALFPMGCVPKPHDLKVMRPTSDHTKSGWNSHTVMGVLGHTLDTFKRVSWLLKKNTFMYVSDVEDAFMLIPLASWVWWFFLCRGFASYKDCEESVFMHLFADFGSRGMPGTFKLFLVDVVIQMALSEFVLTLPVVVHVDDLACFHDDEEALNEEMRLFQLWSTLVCGVGWKLSKDKKAALLQLFCGFWWDSRDLTLRLMEEKLAIYLDCFQEAARSRVLTLVSRQSLAGRAQRALYTFPKGGSCLLAVIYRMMGGLKLPWHQSKTIRDERSCYQLIHDLLRLNLGRGYYRLDDFSVGVGMVSDACKSSKLTGAGWVCQDGDADYWKMGTSAARNPIDEIEGDTVVRACVANAHKWHKCIVPFGIDNTAFERSVAKGRSKVDRLNRLCVETFVLQIKFVFVMQPYYISSGDNYLADSLSRFEVSDFLAQIYSSGFLLRDAVVRLHPEAGRTVTFDRSSDANDLRALRQLLRTYSSNVDLDGASASRASGGLGGIAQLLSVSYPPSSIWDGLPLDEVERVEEVMDNRLKTNSKRKIMTAYRKWEAHCEERGWDLLLTTGMACRGGRLVSWVMSMVDDSELVYGSISTMVWGLRCYMVFKHQADPAFGVMFWREFMMGVSVLTSVPSEPRRQVPLETLDKVLDALDPSDFEDANFGLLVVVVLLTFSRMETPCPKTWDGMENFDPQFHWLSKDFKLRRGPNDQWVLWVRFKGYKQDQRIERPSASDSSFDLPFDHEDDSFGRDWVPVGDIPGTRYSVSKWYMAAARALGRGRSPDEPMFLAKDKVRSYTYACFMADFRGWLEAVGGDVTLGPHGIRVLGYNLSKEGNGIDLTVAHGGWLSSGHTRYARFSYWDALNIGARMFSMDPVYNQKHGLTLAKPSKMMRGPVPGGAFQGAFKDRSAFENADFNAGDRYDVVGGSDDDDDNLGDLDFTPLNRPGMRKGSRVGVRDTDPEAPPGFVREERLAATCKYHVWYDSSGNRFGSRNDAWNSVGGRPTRSRTSIGDDEFGNPGGSSDVVRLSPLLPAVNTKCRRHGCIVPAVDGDHHGHHKFVNS